MKKVKRRLKVPLLLSAAAAICFPLLVTSVSAAQQEQSQQTAPVSGQQPQQSAVQSYSTPEFMQGMAYYRRHRFADAIAQFQKTVEANPNNAAAYYFMGYAQYVTGKHAQAIQSFNKAFTADPRFDPRPYFLMRLR